MSEQVAECLTAEPLAPLSLTIGGVEVAEGILVLVVETETKQVE